MLRSASIASAIKFLEERVVSTQGILNGLQLTLECLTLLDLYQKYFPKEFAKLDIKWSHAESVAMACEQFVHNVDAHLFPCHCPMDAYDSDEGPEFSWILISAPWPAWWEGYDLSPLTRVILRTTGEIVDKGEHYYQNNRSTENYIHHESLKALCAGKREPLSHLPVAISFVMKYTNNCWCDLTDEGACSEMPEWSEANVKFLADEWKDALVIYGKFRHLEQWMAEDMKRVETIERLIKKAMKSVIRVQAAPGQPLVKQLANVLEEGEEHDNLEE